MEVANELKRLTNDAYTIGLYDEEEERRRIENSIKISAKSQGIKQGIKQEVKQGIKQGANNEKKSIAKSMLSKKMDISLISELTGLSKKQISMLL